MSLILPPKTHPARELIDLAQLASLGEVQNRMKLPTLQQAKSSALKTFEIDNAIRQVIVLVLYPEGDLKLVEFEPNGEKKVLWNFGNLEMVH